MGNTEVLLTNVTMREANVDKIYVLNKVKALMTIPKTDFVTGQMVADYYEVSLKTIQTTALRHADELRNDGVRCVVANDFLNLHDEDLARIENIPGKKHVVYNSGLEYDIPNRGMMVYPRRAILRIGMLLRDSEIAKAVRTALLDTEEKSQVVTPTNSNALLAAITEQSKTISEQSRQIDKLLTLVETLVPMVAQKSPMEETPTVVAKVVETKPVTTPEPKPVAYIKKKGDQPTWYEIVNALIQQACYATSMNRNAVLSAAYKTMDSQYGLCLSQYAKEYKKIKGCAASMLETVHWVETVKNPVTEGLLTGILERMIETRKAC